MYGIDADFAKILWRFNMAIGSFGTIRIHRQIPIVAGFVQLPPNKVRNRADVSSEEALSVSDTKLVRLGITGGHSTAGLKGVQEYIELPGVPVDEVDHVYNEVNSLQSY